MEKKEAFRKKTWIRSWKLVHFLVTMALLYVCWQTSYNHINLLNNDSMQAGTVMAIYGVLMVLMLRTYNAYRISLSSVKTLIYSQALSQLVCVGIVYLLMCFNELHLVNPVPMLLLLVSQLAVDAVWSILARKLYFLLTPVKKTALIYQNRSDLSRFKEVYRFAKKFDVTQILPASLSKEQMITQLDGCKAVFIALDEGALRSEVIQWCIEENVDAYIVPTVGDIILAGAIHMEMFSSPVVRVIRNRPKAEYAFLKRSVDILCSLAGIAVLWPFMLITAIAVKLYDGGPALYKQVRLTQDGKEFKILKFRSMRVDAEKDGVARLATEDDHRITPIGKIIRACRFDELPQLFNILLGDMTIVGPRPERPEIAAQYEETLPEFRLRLQVKAGLTGFAQVYGKYNTSPKEKLQMDLMYINSMSFLEDLKLMFATVKILFVKESTSGITEGQTTAAVDEEEAAV